MRRILVLALLSVLVRPDLVAAQIPDTPATIEAFLGATFAPLAPKLLTPANGAMLVSPTPFVSWTCTGLNATGFDIQLATTNPPTLYPGASNLATCSWSPPTALTAGTKYFLRVVSRNAKGPPANGALISFTTGTSVVPSPNCTRITPGAGQVVRANGEIWTIGVGTVPPAGPILRNGAATGGLGSILVVTGGQIQVLGDDPTPTWYLWNDTTASYQATGAGDPCAPPPPPGAIKLGWDQEPAAANVVTYHLWLDGVVTPPVVPIDLTCPGRLCIATMRVPSGAHVLAVSAVDTTGSESSIVGCASCTVPVTVP